MSPLLNSNSAADIAELWLRESLFDNKLVIRVGKTVPTFDFNNVSRPGIHTMPASIANASRPSTSDKEEICR